MIKKIKDIDIDAVFTKEKIGQIFEELKIPIENRETFFENIKESLKLFKEEVKQSIASKAQKEILKNVHKKCHQIIEKTNLFYSAFVADLFFVTEAQEDKVRQAIRRDVEELVEIIGSLPEEIMAFFEDGMKNSSNAICSIEERLRDPLLQHQSIRLLCGLCVSGGCFKKGHIRSNGKFSRGTLQANYRVIDATQGLVGRPKNYYELLLCWRLAIDYYKAKGEMPYRNIMDIDYSKEVPNTSLHDRGPFVTLIEGVFRIVDISVSTDDLVKKYISLFKEKYQVYIISDFDKMMERHSSVLSNYPSMNAILVVEMNAYFSIRGQFFKNSEGELIAIKIPSNIDIKDFLKNGSWKINHKNRFRVMKLLNHLADRAGLPRAYIPKKIISIGF